ncbi:MAG: SusC/RagA family TonB-linked outer membrane protein [Flavobacteriaceae bacterium]|nr:SusC/RagA family TonB-linked outer membrane protein [Flavobacteriaceae bacterium]MCY4215988.1 SusC/RagA family TonB-linked outer membrane protein [Flavobacteriaceae bacterium]
MAPLKLGGGYFTKWYLSISFIILLCTSLIYSQDSLTVSGNVSDQAGIPLFGATIVEKGTANGVSSDFDGNYSIEVTDSNATLVFNYVGYSEQEIVLNGDSKVNVFLIQSNSTLNEVVVVGYGAVIKKDLTGAVAQLDAAEVSHQSTNSVTDILRSNVAGLSVGFSNSPSGVSNVRIRGNNSITADASPLIVVDGFIFNGNLADIAPSDIDKLDVLKDASSAAVYGSRGANGVILITTKRGETEKPTININTSLGIAQDASKERPYSADEYDDWRINVFKSSRGNLAAEKIGYFDSPNNLPSGISLDNWLAYDGGQGDPTRVWLNRIGFQDVEIKNYLNGDSIDWYDRINQLGFRNEMNTSISGRKGELTYYWSLGRQDNEGITVGQEFESIRSRLNLDAKINNWLTIGINAQFAKQDNSSIPANRSQIVLSSPWGSEFDDEGNIRLSPQDDSGAGAVNAFLRRKFSDRIDLAHTFNSRLYTKVQLPFGFSYELGYTTRLEFLEFYDFSYAANPSNQVASGDRNLTKINEWQLDNILRWNKTFDKHSFDFTFLVYAEKYQSYFTRGLADTFEPSDALGFSSLERGNVQKTDSEDTTSTGDAYMTRLGYTFDSKYLLNFILRRDGYSAFGANNKRAYFPSLSGAWIISEEDFFNSNFINFFKLRISYGENGNRNIGRFSSLSRLTAGNYLNVDSNGRVFQVPTFNNDSQENKDLKWERTRAINFGLDFSFLDGRIEGNLDAYSNITDDLIITRQLPNIIGFDEVITNLGEIQNQGFELAVSSQNYDKENFKWNTRFNFSLNRNKINELYGDLDEEGNELDDFTNQRFIGKATDVIWGREATGVWQTSEIAEASKYGVAPGDFKIRDVNNDGLLDINDNVFQGHRTPRFRWGLTNSFVLYRNIDFSFELYSNWGQKRLFNEAKNRNGFIDRTNSIKTPYWTEENPRDDYARLFSNDGSATFNIYRDASFIRLSNVTVAYRFPRQLSEKIAISNARVYLNARNLAVFTKDWDFFDPEPVDIEGRFINDEGNFVNNISQPTVRFFTIGLDLTL